MSDIFVPPPITTKGDRGQVQLDAVFVIELELGERALEETPHGARIHQKVRGGTVRGPRLAGKVYPRGGGEFGLVRTVDQVEESFCRFMIRADNGEWLYTHFNAYVRPDGYARFQAQFDADVQGPHGWLNENMFIGTLEQMGANRRRMTYFEAT